MSMKAQILFLFSIYCFLIGSTPVMKAQTGKFYSTDKELSNSLINAVYQDRKGFIWIATENGLNKFDGTRFSIYRHNATDSTSLKNNYVRTLFEDSRGNFWIGCINGLQRYDRTTDNFHELFISRKDGRKNPHITSIIERRNGDLWIATSGQGAISLKKNSNPASFHIETELTDRIGSNYLNVIFEDSRQNLWIATEEKGLYRYSPESKELKSYKAPYHIAGDDVSAICEDAHGQIFVGTLTKGLFRLSSRQEGNFEPILYQNRMNLNIRTLIIDTRGKLIIGTDGEGVKEYQPQQDIIVDSEINAGPFDFSKSKVHSLIEDKDHNLWLGIFQKGLILVPGISNKFDYYGYKSIHNNTIGSSCVMAIHTDEQATIWIGTDNDGLYAINDQGKQLRHYTHQAGNPQSVPGTILCLYEDSNQELWLGSYFDGLARINKQTGTCQDVTSLLQGNLNAGKPKVSCIIEDKNKNLWVGTYGSGLYKINLPTQHVTYYESTRNENDDWSINRLPNDWISYLLEDKEGMIWIGTYKGLAVLNPQTDNFINYKKQNNLLPGYVVYSLLESSNGEIWAGTSEGLVCLNKDRLTPVLFTTADGLPSDIICGLAEDEKKNIWISTHQGISKLNPPEKKFINYYAGDGLQGNEFTRTAVFKDKRGKIFFGGTNGVTAFYPQDITEIKKEMNVLITGFHVANRPVKKGDKSGNNVITDTAVMDTEQFTLAYNENTFSIDFSVLEFSNPDRISYQYKIKELGDEWISTQPGTNRVTYSSLKPGKYTFSVQARDHNNFSNIRTVTIAITPPWYQTWWAKVIWGCLGALLIYALTMYILSRIRHRQEVMRQKHMEQINEAKLQFFINISHEIRTPMTLIISPLEKLLAEHSEKQPVYLMIYRNAQRILRLINQLMDIRKLDKGQMHLKFRETDIVGFINDLMQTFNYQAQKKNITFTFEKELEGADSLKVWIDLNNFDKVLMNVLSNAFKYTHEGGNIEVSLKTGHNDAYRSALKDYFEIDITDNGIGIDKNKIEQIFERFYQIDNDMTQSNFGTGIGLHLSRSLVELHHGIIKAENREDGQGTRFIIRLPLGSNHLKAEELENPEETGSEPTISQLPKDSIYETEEENKTNEYRKPKAKTRYRVLIVEDDEEIRRYIRSELDSDFRIYECTNGREGLETILKEKPDLVISDVMMPEMDGITLCRKIKQNININHIPIILLTAKSKAEDQIEGLEIGADAYIVKPFNTELLRTTISNLIANRERLRGKLVGEQQVEEKITKIEMKSNDEILMSKVMKTINDHLADPTLNVEMLAANVGMSRVHMHRKLKELTNQSARDFIRSIRLKQAANLLREKNLSVSEVAYATGFSNLSHFSNTFRDFYGISPSEYKEQQM
ncbi:two-component regulator propeller domain-containing protein [Bacteroides ovatus]|uniref:hybrid sensor histidine kinase/response regulator transcription factor n=1 Tax=Bacteroides ovatus TaxID=28116 RepID=UPI002165EBC7|nr:two-component regulator propeller domain-containing protein [Bacteroides ovatus]MCS2640889.1 response regulator [Bacteroides ovatus]